RRWRWPAPGRSACSCGDRLEERHHGLVGPVVWVLVYLRVAAGADRRVALLACTESVPKLLHFVGRHVVGATLGRGLGHLAKEMIQKPIAKPNGSNTAKSSMECIRRLSVTSNSGLRLYFFARSLTALLIIMYSKMSSTAPMARPMRRPCRAESMRPTVA